MVLPSQAPLLVWQVATHVKLALSSLPVRSSPERARLGRLARLYSGVRGCEWFVQDLVLARIEESAVIACVLTRIEESAVIACVLTLAAGQMSCTAVREIAVGEELKVDYFYPGPLSSEEGTTSKVFRTFTWKPGPESCLYCLICAEVLILSSVPR